MSSLFVFDGMKRPAFPVKIDVESSTVADLFREVARSYTLELDPLKDLRIIFVDKELKYTKKIMLRKVSIINDSTIAVIFRLPDTRLTAPASATEDADAVKSVEAKINEENKDAEEGSIAESELVTRVEECKDDEDVPVAESSPVTPKKKPKKKKKKAAKVVPSLEDAFDSLAVMTNLEDKEATDVPAAESEPAKGKKKRKRNRKKTGKTAHDLNEMDIESKRPVLEHLPQNLELTFKPDLLDFDTTQCRAKLPPCSHVMGSETMRYYCHYEIEAGHTKFACPYQLNPFFDDKCPAMWEYRHVRHVACFTTKEMHETERTIAINFAGKDSSTLTCPGCFTWCSKADPKQTRMRCFICTREAGKEFLFCGYCLSEWKNPHSGRCANLNCKSIEATLDILLNSPMIDVALYGREWPTIRLCPRCGLLTEFMGKCARVHCQLCHYYYCFMCLKGSKYEARLCASYISLCQIASVQSSIPEWDGREYDSD